MKNFRRRVPNFCLLVGLNQVYDRRSAVEYYCIFLSDLVESLRAFRVLELDIGEARLLLAFAGSCERG